jgi:hypothetical protein
MLSPNPHRFLSLSSKGLQRIDITQEGNDFAFIVGDDRYICPSFIAEFLSPRASSLLALDRTISDFHIETPDPHHCFSTIMSLASGGTVELPSDSESTHAHCVFIRSVSRELGNCELFQATIDRSEGQLSRAELIAHLDFFSEAKFDVELHTLASTFSEFSKSELDQLRLSDLERVLSDSNLVVTSEDWLLDLVCRRALCDSSYFGLLEFVRFEYLSRESMESAIELLAGSIEFLTPGIWSALVNRLTAPVLDAVRRFDGSNIITSLPDILDMFAGNEFRLLYRGSRDGFDREVFHQRCDGHGNTMTLIESTGGYIFGGYSPLVWRSGGGFISDPSWSSFVFTLRNPHNFGERIFRQIKAESAIYNGADRGPTLGGGCDICVLGSTAFGDDILIDNHTILGCTYQNDTGLARERVFTGSRQFQLQEVEVFEVCTSTLGIASNGGE